MKTAGSLQKFLDIYVSFGIRDPSFPSCRVHYTQWLDRHPAQFKILCRLRPTNCPHSRHIHRNVRPIHPHSFQREPSKRGLDSLGPWPSRRSPMGWLPHKTFLLWQKEAKYVQHAQVPLNGPYRDYPMPENCTPLIRSLHAQKIASITTPPLTARANSRTPPTTRSSWTGMSRTTTTRLAPLSGAGTKTGMRRGIFQMEGQRDGK